LPCICYQSLTFHTFHFSVANLKFAVAAEPDNADVAAKAAWAAVQRAKGEPTTPTTVAEEKTYNPFMRLSSPALLSFLNLTADAPAAKVMDALRAAKNEFRG
jgi:hydroxyacylglutathione hydrolase